MVAKFGSAVRVRRFSFGVAGGVSGAALVIGLLAMPAAAATLQANQSPGANNNGGSNPGRADIITIAGGADTITGDYALGGTSARRFLPDSATLAQRFAAGDVVSGYDQVQGRSSVALTPTQKTAVATYPDAIRGTNVSVNVYDNSRLVAVDSTTTATFNYVDTNSPVYTDVRLANLSGATVTIATGNKATSIYDRENLAVTTADSGSTLYDVRAGSDVTYDSRTATMSGDSQNGFSQSAQQAIRAPVTTYSGVAFGNGDAVTDLASLRRYNTALIGQLSAGQITPGQYESLIQAAATTAPREVVIRQDAISNYQAPPTTSPRSFMRLDASRLTTTADSLLVGMNFENNFDGGTVLVRASNGATIVNNGQINTAAQANGLELTGAGTTLTNAAGGVIGVGYETLDRSSGTPEPAALNTFFKGYSNDRSAIVAVDGAAVTNLGIVNVANRDIATAEVDPTFGKANHGIVVGSGAVATNGGTILIGGGESRAANALGSYQGAAGMVATQGGTAINAAGGTIRVGTSFAETAADLAAVRDVLSVNDANGLTAVNGAGRIVNAGTIRIGGLAQNANGMLVGNGSTATNSGTITLDPATAPTATTRNTGITVLGHAAAATVPGAAPFVDAVNEAAGIINVQGVNGVGILVADTVTGGAARAANLGTINVGGGLSVDRLRNYGVLVDGATSSALQNGRVALIGDNAVGVHARNGGTIDVGPDAVLTFAGTNQIGYYLLGTGSTINVSAAAAPTVVATAGSTGVRVEGGARLAGTGIDLSVSGANAAGIVATGAGTAIDTTGAVIAVSGGGATGVIVEGGATGSLGAAIALNGANTTAAIVDGQGRALDGSLVGAPDPATRLIGNTNLTSAANGVTGYVARNRGQLANAGAIAFTGTNATGILATSGAAVTNTGTVQVASGTGASIDGAGTTFTGNGAIAADNGVAALRLANGGSASTAANLTGGGTAHAVLLDTGAGALRLGAGTLTTTGTGNGIENVAGSVVRLDGTRIVANGAGSGVRTAVNLDPASTGTIVAAGTNGTAYTFAGVGGAATTGGAALPAGVTISATGAGANGLRLNTSGSATLNGTIEVTAANGGSALIGGPAAAIANTGTLRSASSTSPVVNLGGGTLAFTNTGTITAPDPAAVAIQGGGAAQAVTLAGGAVTGAVQLGGLADTFVMSGGTLTGSVDTGAGDDSATFRNLTDANLAGVTRISGSGAAGGNDTLTFDNTRSTGTRRLVGFNTVALANGSTLTADGDLTPVAGGGLRIDAGSTYFAGNGVNAAVNGSVTTAGTIDLTNGTSGASDTLTVRGNYAASGNATLRLDTVLSATGPSDRLVIDGGTVSGSTSIVVVNAGGLGAQTTGNGIEVVAGINGANTTAATTKNGFTLAGGHVDAGAFQYRLYASDATGGQSWYLRTDAPSGSDPSGNPPSGSNPGGVTPTPPVAFRPEVALITGIPQQLRRQDLDMLGTYHQRMGEKWGDAPDGFAVPGRLWGRAIYDDYRIKSRNAGRSDFDGRVYGFQIGVDAFEFGNAAGRHQIGVYAGYSDGHASVRGFAGGLLNQYVGRTDPKTAYVAAYWTYLANSGFYVDTVVQHAWYYGHGTSAADNRFKIDGTGVLASVETGYSIPLSPRFSIEPQAQLVAQGVSFDDPRIPNASISQHSGGTLTGRLGARVVGNLPLAQRTVQPYVRANLWKQFASSDKTTFSSGGANTLFVTRTSALYGQVGAGVTVPIAPTVALYGEGDHSFTLDNGNSVTGHATVGSIGVKARF